MEAGDFFRPAEKVSGQFFIINLKTTGYEKTPGRPLF